MFAFISFCCVMVLAELFFCIFQALFRALKARSGRTPKYGLLFHSSFIGRVQQQKHRGRMSRYGEQALHLYRHLLLLLALLLLLLVLLLILLVLVLQLGVSISVGKGPLCAEGRPAGAAQG